MNDLELSQTISSRSNHWTYDLFCCIYICGQNVYENSCCSSGERDPRYHNEANGKKVIGGGRIPGLLEPPVYSRAKVGFGALGGILTSGNKVISTTLYRGRIPRLPALRYSVENQYTVHLFCLLFTRNLIIFTSCLRLDHSLILEKHAAFRLHQPYQDPSGKPSSSQAS